MAALTLSSGHKMPAVGLGVWRMESPAIRGLIHSALRVGYRHPRPHPLRPPRRVPPLRLRRMKLKSVMHLQRHSKLDLSRGRILFFHHYQDHGHEACKDSLKKLRLDFLDLYLVHFPVATRHTGVGTTASALGNDGVLDIDTTISLETTWHAIEDLVSMELVRSIGISNYDIFLTRDCLAYAKIEPAVNQIETHPYFQRDSLVKFCQKHGICVTTHTPLGGSTADTEWLGSLSCLDDPVIKAVYLQIPRTVSYHCFMIYTALHFSILHCASLMIISQPAHRTGAVSGWEVQQDAGAGRAPVGAQRNTVTIPKTSKVERLEENFAVLDLDISDEDMEKIKAIDRNYQPAKFWGIDLYA